LQELLSPASSSSATPSSPPSSSSTTPRFALSRFGSPAITSITYFTPALGPDPLERMQRTRSALDDVLRELDGGGGAAKDEPADRLDGGRAPKRRRVGERSGGAAEAASTSALEWRWDEPASASSPAQDEDDGDESARAAHAELVVVARRNVWSRKARRAAAAPAAAAAATSSPPRALLELRLLVDLEPAPSAQVRLTAHWVRGLDADRAAFTGLVGFVTRKVGERLKGGAGVGREVESAKAQGGEEGRERDEA